MLVIVEDRNVTDLLQALLDLEAAGRADVLEVDAAERAGDEIDGADQLLGVFGADAEREGVHIGKFLEERALALHDGHARLGTDVAETEHGGAVGDDRDKVGAAGQLEGLVVVLLDFKAGLRNAGGVGDRQIVAVVDAAARNDLDLAFPVVMCLERFLFDVHSCILSRNDAIVFTMIISSQRRFRWNSF